MTILQNIFSAAPKKLAILLWGLVLLATVFASVGCAQPQSVLGGKKLILEFTDSTISFNFPQGDEYSMTRGADSAHPHRFYHRYNAKTQEFYEMSELLNVTDGRGESLWHLDFTTPTTGKATLLKKHPWAFQGKNIGFSVPFRIAPLSATALTISVYPGYDTKRLSGDAAESILRELKDLCATSTERTLTGNTLPMLSAEGALIGHAQYDSPLVDIEDGEQSWTIARGLRANEALLLSQGTDPYRVPNQQKMLLLLKKLGVKH